MTAKYARSATTARRLVRDRQIIQLELWGTEELYCQAHQDTLPESYRFQIIPLQLTELNKLCDLSGFLTRLRHAG